MGISPKASLSIFVFLAVGMFGVLFYDSKDVLIPRDIDLSFEKQKEDKIIFSETVEKEEPIEEVVDQTPTIEEPDIIEEENTVLFLDEFDQNRVILQDGEAYRHRGGDWWLNSGAYFYVENGFGSTIQGRLDEDDPRRESYLWKAESTDGGYRPQNIFRFLTNETYKNFSIETKFKVTDTDLTPSIERDESDGILLFGHFEDGDNLYYAGIRVDGRLVIKKKYEGRYTTLAVKDLLPGEYDKYSYPNLIPENTWIIQRVSYETNPNGTSILVEIDTNSDGTFDDSLSFVDDGRHSGSSPYSDEGYSGIRTDFMDVVFDYVEIKQL